MALSVPLKYLTEEKNGHFLSSLFVAVALGILRPLAPLASGQHPLFRLFFIHTGTIEGADAKSFAGTIFLMYGLGLNSVSTCCEMGTRMTVASELRLVSQCQRHPHKFRHKIWIFFGLSMAALAHVYTFSIIKVVLPY